MGLTIQMQNLNSRIERLQIGGGIRKFTIHGGELSADPPKGVLGTIFSFVGFLFVDSLKLLLAGVQISFTKAFAILRAIVGYFWNFNWNLTWGDATQEGLKSLEAAATQLSYLTGSAIGYAVCGAIPGVVISTFNEALAVEIYEKIGEQALMNLSAQLSGLLQQTAQQFGKAIADFIFSTPHTLMKFETDSISQVFQAFAGPEKIKKFREHKEKPWSLHTTAQGVVDSIPSETARQVIDQFFSGLGQSCVESGYIVAGLLDSYYIQAHQVNRGLLGNEAETVIVPNPQYVHGVEQNQQQ